MSALTAWPVEGAFVFGAYNVASSLIAGGLAPLRAAAGGLAVGRFGWASDEGIAANTRAADTDRLGFVMPKLGPFFDRSGQFFDEALQAVKVREGLPVTLLATGQVWAKFPNGARVHDRVYARLLDGVAFSGPNDDSELTQWAVDCDCAPGGLAIISTWSVSA